MTYLEKCKRLLQLYSYHPSETREEWDIRQAEIQQLEKEIIEDTNENTTRD